MSDTDSQALDCIVTEAPDLVNETYKNGDTPLPTALDRFNNYFAKSRDIHVLILAGTDFQLANSKGDTGVRLLVGEIWLHNAEGVVIGERRKLFDRVMEMGVDISVRSHRPTIFMFFRIHKCYRATSQVQQGPGPCRTAEEIAIE